MDNERRLVLLTGATGHVGFAVLVEALEAEYNVRVVLREISKADSILSSEPVKNALSSTAAPELSFVEVPDMTVPGAFDSAMQSVTYVVHCASPINRGKFRDFQTELIDPAVKGTTNILKAAHATPSVLRVVITSSNSAIVNHNILPAPGTCVSPSDRQPDYPLDVAMHDADEAYSAAKTSALNATDTFVSSANDLRFDVVSIMPTFVFGPKELAKSPGDIIDGSNVFGIGLVLIKQSWGSLRIEAVSCHIDDVAQAHVQALNHDEDVQFPFKAGTHRSCLLASSFRPDEVRDIVEREFPKESWQGEEAVFRGKGSYAWYHTDYDVSAAEKLLGRKLKGIVEQIRSSGLQVLRIA
uniref:NAD-dependent epimerase/dehydratase ALT6 n=1 Tax=Alternaria alternata TaxID=5599 RepID=ALT6_ALTAL|nr:RecName: Full=NAD-dependent epimerase/dehydratase ALT6; AltName: Full=AAL-toxin biosynthesis cluster protein 6 [Alternaria alternata]BBG74268.1 cinnamyl-alcohol dehydrogenase [Alternaria alternata]